MQENSSEVSVIDTQTQAEVYDKPALVEEQARPDNKSEFSSSSKRSPKPSGRERRLQAPVFKERLDKFLSKLKMREVKSELDTINDIEKEVQRYFERDKIQALYNNAQEVVIEELKIPESANFSTEIIENSDDQPEIRLRREDGEMKSLTECLPNGYKFQEGNICRVDHKRRTITINTEFLHSRTSALIVLHELGHANNYESEKVDTHGLTPVALGT